jgi:predicted MFS family arabinose efflux permease
LASVLRSLQAYKNAFSHPIDSRYDIVLLGGALGSLFSFLQALASPVIGALSDKYGRRRALLVSMCGNILSVLLWLLATDFRTFLLSRIVGGLSEGNVQIATAIAADISDESQRGGTMALVGACFCIAFTFGPALGAWLSSIPLVASNPFATAAGFSLFLVVVETLYLYVALPETLPSMTKASSTSATAKKPAPAPPTTRTNSHLVLNTTHFLFILIFSGMEFSLPFMTHSLFSFSASQNGRLLGYMGLIASLLQGGLTRRISPLLAVRLGVVSCLAAFALLSTITTTSGLYVVATLLAITTATVVTGLNSLSSFEAAEDERGVKLGGLRSWGQVGRAIGPVSFCTLYWWAGRERAYQCGTGAMVLVATFAFLGLRGPKKTVQTVKSTAGRVKEL